MLSTVGGALRRCSRSASFRMRKRFVTTLKPVMSGVWPTGCGKIPAAVICSSSTSEGRRRPWASSRRRHIVRARRHAVLLSAWNSSQ